MKALHMKRRDIVTALKAEDYVIGNAVVQWNNYPRTAVAKRVLRGCLR